MDYDENDFQSQSFQLAGEESTKFPPGLRSYALPKFDLDDNLQVQLRFDSLVETEVLLGIQSQEDNQWIEEFSRGSSGIEFSSGAAQSCSISRHNNVWSEATSSESVEMLLKSVGQDEMINGQTILEESVACDGLDTLTKQMELNLNRDGSIPSMLGDVVDLGPTLPPEKCLESFSREGEDAETKLCHAEATPQTNKGRESGSGSSGHLGPSMVGEKCGQPVTKESLLIDGKCDDANRREDSCLVDGSVENETLNNSVASEDMQADHSVVSVHNLVPSVREMNALDQQQVNEGHNEVISYKYPDGLRKDNVEQEGEHQVLSKEALMDDNNCEGTAAETSINNMENPSNLAMDLDSTMQLKEGCSEGVCSEQPFQVSEGEAVVSSKDFEMDDKLIGNKHEASIMVVEGDNSFEGKAVVVSSSDTGNQSTNVLEMDPLEQISQGQSNVPSFEKQEDSLKGDGHQLEYGVSVGSSETSLLIEEDGEPFKGQCKPSSNNIVGNPSSLMVELCSSTNIIHETLGTENIKDGHDSLGVHGVDHSVEDHISSTMQVESMHICKTNIVIGPDDVSVLEKENVRIPIDSGNVKTEINDSLTVEKRVESSSQDQSTGKIEVVISLSPSDRIVGDESASTGFVSNVTYLASCNKLDGIHHLLPGKGVTPDKFVEHKEDEKLSSCVGEATHLGKKEETIADISTEPNLLVVKEFSLPASELEQCVVPDGVGELLSERAGQLSSSLETVSIECQNEPQAVIGTKAAQEYSEELEGRPIIHDLVLKENDGAEVIGVSHETHEEASLKKSGTMPSHGEALTQPVPSSLEESSCDIGQKDQEDITASLVSEDNNAVQDQEDSKASLVSEDNNAGQIVLPSIEGDTVNGCKGDTVNGCKGSSKPTAVSKDNSEFHAMEVESSSPNSDELKCGSPIVISCSELLQNEKEKLEQGKGSIVQNAAVSHDVHEEARKVGSSAHDIEGNVTAEDDRSFTFEVSSQADLSDRETDKGWKPFSSIQPFEFHQTKEGSPPTSSGLRQMDPKMLEKISHGSPRASDQENVRGSSKGTAVHKTRRTSSKVTDREITKERKSLKEVTPVKQTKDRGSNSGNVSPSSLGAISQVVQVVEEMPPCGYAEGSAGKSCSIVTVQTSSLPDLNTSASPSALFQQPFTDSQQVQLRAQIFVYGSLIQGTAPDEACMITAFGESGGGRSVWDNVWRATLERLHNQKSSLSNQETPLHLHSGARAHEQATRQGTLQSKALGTPAGRAGSKGPPSGIISPMIPQSSSLWSVSTPSRDGLQSGSMPRSPLLDANQTLPPLHPYQSPHAKHYVGSTTPWLPQTPSAGPWFFSPQTSALDVSAHYSPLPITETGRVTSFRESFTPRPSATQHSTPSPLVHSGGPTAVPVGTTPLLEVKRTTSSPGKQASADTRPRKKKKSPVSEEPGHTCLVAQSQTEPVSATGVTNPLQTSVAITAPAGSVAKIAGSNSVSSGSPMSCTHYQIVGGRDTEQRVIFSDETCTKVEQAKLQAEDAAALAATAVRHSQDIWSQLAIQNGSGLAPDVEAKLASAAVAVAAAASVAKAAAAAAKVACDAALQAKLLADEALVSSRNVNPTQNIELSFSDGVNSLGLVTPASILKGKGRANDSGSAIVAAKEASRRRVEAAASATKRAENLDAVVKAAELAAEAVSQAGAIIAMGDPIPLTLSELLESGPDGFWKVQQVPSEQLVKSSNMNEGDKSNLDGVEGLDRSAKHFNERSSSKKETQLPTDQGKPPSPQKMARQSVENHMGLVNGMQWDLVTSNERGLGGEKGRKMSDLAKTIGVVPESEIGSRPDTDTVTVQNEEREGHQPVGTSTDSSIKEGSYVEVLSDEDGVRKAWFSAKVLSLKDGKAYVYYTELLPDKGSGQLKEWVPLEAEGDKAPRIRIARSMTAMKFEGTRKRRRAAIGDYVWSVGDRVDAWTRDGWWEGVITEKSKEDETMLTVRFPAQGDSSSVRAWHLRPSLVWKDGQWIEWSRSWENNPHLHEGDTPREKRTKFGRDSVGSDPAVEARGKDKMSKSTLIGESVKPEESRSLALSAKEKIFTVGKNIREGNYSDALRTKRTGLQKEGSRVIFGIPKPGKKRKFMEVSKHYVAHMGGQTSEGNDSIKFAKYLIPQGSGSRGWKSTSKVDSKGKRAAESKPKVFKSGKTNRNLSEKDSSVVSVPNDATMPDQLWSAKASDGHDENMLGSGSHNIHKATEGSTLFSSLALAPDAPFSKKGKFVPSVEKLSRNEEKDAAHNDNPGKSLLDAVEPRRSNRRIQPTSRLLEGLQSSLIISKIPAVSHDKGSKAQHRSMSSSRGNNHS